MTTIIVTRTPQGLFQAIGTRDDGERVCKYEANRAQGIQDALERYHEGAAIEWRVDQRQP